MAAPQVERMVDDLRAKVDALQAKLVGSEAFIDEIANKLKPVSTWIHGSTQEGAVCMELTRLIQDRREGRLPPVV